MGVTLRRGRHLLPNQRRLKMPKSLMRALVALAVGILFVFVSQETGALAAETTGTLTGTVTDSAGHPIAGVAISAVAPTGSSKTVTGANGFYVIAGLAPDTYTITFSKQGFQATQVTGVTIVQGQTQNV